MKNLHSEGLRLNTMVIFWLGMLTGALVVGLIFFYRFISPGEYQSAILRNNAPNKINSQQFGQKMAPKNLKSFPTPPGNLNAFPTPPGN